MSSDAAYHRAYRQRRRAAGICTRCPSPPAPGKAVCVECAERIRTNARLRARGLPPPPRRSRSKRNEAFWRCWSCGALVWESDMVDHDMEHIAVGHQPPLWTVVGAPDTVLPEDDNADLPP